MVDQTIIKEMKETEKRIEQHFRQLEEVDGQRTTNFQDYLTPEKRRREDLVFFQKYTLDSISLFRNIERDYHRLLGYVLLIEDRGHKSEAFQKLLKRVRYLEKLLHTFYALRKNQAAITYSLLQEKKIIGGTFIGDAVSSVQRKRLILSFGKEKDLVAIFVGLYKHEKERIDAIFLAYENEKKKGLAMAGVSLTITVLVPAVGTALGLAVYAALQWANRSSANHKRLMKLINPGEEDGS